MREHILELQDVCITLNRQAIVEINRTIKAGEVLTVMGPSGSGKTSLLAYIAGFLGSAFQASGRIVIDGKDVSELPAEQRKAGLLFQDPMLFPHLSVGENLRFGIPQGDTNKQELVMCSLQEIGLAGYADRDPGTLSGGQAARVALMRLLLSRPRVVLLDEPFSKLDATLRSEIRLQVFERLRKAGLPTILVTHDAADAVAANGQVFQI
ncbi:MAG: ATP-binding cassette domain-containing protein [Gammaproteobacteria bacterium]|nr:ATP-binding cassette domain-containing protein [Gammaproteobacteria bacterium]